MNSLITTAGPRSADLELVPFERPIFDRAPPRPTALEQLLAVAYRQRLVIIVIMSVAILIGAYLAITSEPRYTAVASVQLDQQAPKVFADQSLDPQSGEKDADRFLQTQLDRAQSRTIAEAVASKLKLANSPAALQALGVEASSSEIAQQAAVTKVQEGVELTLGLNTRVAQLSFTSGDPNVSATVANAFAEALVAANIDAKLQASARAKQYLTEQLVVAKKRLEGSERQMLAYARSADLTTTVVPNSAGNDRGGSLRAQQLGLMTDSLAQATARRIDAQQQWAQVQRASPLSLPEVQSNSAIQNLVAQKAQLQAALEEERQRHTEEYPTVRETAAKIAELDGQIAGFASRIKSSFQGRYVAAAQQEQQMARTVGGLRGAAMSERERSVGFNSLSREVETNKAFYDGLLQRYKEVAAGAGAAAANISIVDRAWPPGSPDSSHAVRNLALASMAGLILALFVGSVRERMHNVIRSTEELEQGFNLPALGVVPRLAGPGEIEAALRDPGSAQAEAYHSIAVALEEASSGTLPKTLLITSSTASEGKSTSALALARSLSAMGKRVLLVDADLRRASAVHASGNQPTSGLSEVLAGTSTAENAIDNNVGEGFSIVASGRVSSSPVTLLASNHMKRAIDQLAADHDIVIFDGPPILGLADAVLLARSVDAVLLVVEANATHSNELDIAMSRLPQTNIIGGIITKFDAKAAGVRYGDYNYYTYKHAN
jgi:capsular exopolysaccharide synthesis family protein